MFISQHWKALREQVDGAGDGNGGNTPPIAPPPPPPVPAETPPPAAGTASFTPEQQAHIDRIVAAERRKSQESDDAKAGRAAVKRLADIEAEQLTETQRLTKERDEAKAERDRMATARREALVRARFIAEAASKAIPVDRIDDAFRLADLSTVTVEEDGSVSGVEPALKALVDAKPWLVRTPEQERRTSPNTNGSGGIGGNSKADPVETYLKRYELRK